MPPLATIVTESEIFKGSVGPAREKLRAVLEDYRKENYAQTMPSRFVKNILDAADENGDGVITESEVRHLLERIGAGGKLSDEDIHGCMLEFGVTDGEIPAETLKDILLNTGKKA